MANYAIIDEKNGWLLNTVVWDGDLNKWQPPQGSIAKLVEEIDFEKIPKKPEEY